MQTPIPSLLHLHPLFFSITIYKQYARLCLVFLSIFTSEFRSALRMKPIGLKTWNIVYAYQSPNLHILKLLQIIIRRTNTSFYVLIQNNKSKNANLHMCEIWKLWIVVQTPKTILQQRIHRLLTLALTFQQTNATSNNNHISSLLSRNNIIDAHTQAAYTFSHNNMHRNSHLGMLTNEPVVF